MADEQNPQLEPFSGRESFGFAQDRLRGSPLAKS
jgi:hypothetical protein